MAIKNNITPELIRQRGYRSISRLSRSCDLHASTLYSIISGKAEGSLRTRKKIADQLGIPEKELFFVE